VSDIVKNLTPPALWNHFVAIANIPRPSKREGRVAAHVLKLASEAGLESHQDETGNIVVRKPASAGREKSPTGM